MAATSDLNMYQTAGNVAAGGVGVGASIGILVAKSADHSSHWQRG